MGRKNVPEARNRILQAARKVFAEKSFAGARVDEIAQEAGVPKSVIYYHFESKDAILEVMVREFLQSYLELIAVADGDTHQSKAEELPERIRGRYETFEMENEDLIRIIMMESLKKSGGTPLVFQIAEGMIDREASFTGLTEKEEYDRKERLVAEFFTHIIPKYAYICFREAWMTHFSMEDEEMSVLFRQVFMATHGAYHKYHD